MNIADASWPQYLAALAQAEKERAYAVAFRVANNSATAEEAVQEAVLRLLRRPPKEITEDAIRALFFTAVRKTALELARTARRRRHYEGNCGLNLEMSGRQPAEKSFVSDESTRILQAALAALPQKEREAIGLCYEMNFTQRQAAKVLGTSQKTVSNLLKSGLDKLRKTMANQGVSAAVPATLISMLGSMPKPVLPTNLGRFLDRFAADPTAVIFSTGKQTALSAASAKSTAATVWLPLALAAATAATAVVVWQWNFSVPTTDAALGAVELRRDQVSVPEEKNKFGAVGWSFHDGPPDNSSAIGLQVIQGKWTWRKNQETVRGEMVAFEGGAVGVVPQLKLGEQPFEVKFTLNPFCASDKKFLTENKKTISSFNAYWVSRTGMVPHRKWSRPLRDLLFDDDVKSQPIARTIFYGKYAFQYVEDQLILICEYDRPHPGDHVCFVFENCAVAKIEIRMLCAEELAEAPRDSEALIEQYNLRLLPPKK